MPGSRGPSASVAPDRLASKRHWGQSNAVAWPTMRTKASDSAFRRRDDERPGAGLWRMMWWQGIVVILLPYRGNVKSFCRSASIPAPRTHSVWPEAMCGGGGLLSASAAGTTASGCPHSTASLDRHCLGAVWATASRPGSARSDDRPCFGQFADTTGQIVSYAGKPLMEPVPQPLLVFRD